MALIWLKPSYAAGTLAGGATPAEGIPGNHYGAVNTQYDQDGGKPLFVPNGFYYCYQNMSPEYSEYRNVDGAPLSGTWPPQDATAAEIHAYNLQQRNWCPYWQYPKDSPNNPPDNKKAMWLYFDWDQSPDAVNITAVNSITVYSIQKRMYTADLPSRPISWRVAFYKHTSDFPAIPPDAPVPGQFVNQDTHWGAGILPYARANSKWYEGIGENNFTTQPGGGAFVYADRAKYWLYLSWLASIYGSGGSQSEHGFAKVWLSLDVTLGAGTPAGGALGVHNGYTG